MPQLKFSEYLAGTLTSYRVAAVDATRALRKNWIILPGSAVLYVVNSLAMILFGGMGFGGGMIIGLVEILLLTLYFSWLREATSNGRLDVESMRRIDGSMFTAVINAAFLLYIAKFFVTTLIRGFNMDWIPIVMQLAIVLLLNALPEVIYTRKEDGMQSISEAARFTRDNWIEWFIPFAVILLPWIFVSAETTLLILAQLNELLPGMAVLYTSKLLPLLLYGPSFILSAVALLMGIVGVTWFMLFRGFLFQEFELGSQRQRAFRSRL